MAKNNHFKCDVCPDSCRIEVGDECDAPASCPYDLDEPNWISVGQREGKGAISVREEEQHRLWVRRQEAEITTIELQNEAARKMLEENK